MQAVNAMPWVPGLPEGALSFRKDSAAVAQPTPALVGLTEFYINSAGANINAGSGTGAAIYTSVTGGWSTVTNIFTPADNSNPVATGVQVGMYASIYNDGATTAVYIAAITQVVNAVNGAITVSTTRIYGTAPVTGATVSMTVSGAWIGPSGAVTFPFGLSGTIGALKDANSNQVRLNVKNDQTYTMTAALPFATLGTAVMQGYTSSPGDLGKATFSSNLTSASLFTLAANTACTMIDLVFTNTGASSTRDVFNSANNSHHIFLRCVFNGGMGSGLSCSGSNCYVIECESYNCNRSNSASKGGFQTNAGNGVMLCYNTYSHDHTAGANAHGFNAISSSYLILVNCVADTCGGDGANCSGSSPAGILSFNSNYYNNTGDAIGLDATNVAPGWVVFMNNNFLKNGGKAINAATASLGGILYNNGRGLGNQANVSGDTLKSIVNTGTDIFYPNNTTPWTAPTTGDFSTILPAAIGSGRGVFIETDGTNSGTVAYPEIGAAAYTDPLPTLNTTIAGTTRDSNGNALGLCTVNLFRTSDNLKLSSTTSDASGLFSIAAPAGILCYIVAYLVGSPDVEGTTLNTLAG